MFKSLLITVFALWIIQPLLLKANEISIPINNPMRPPAFALQKIQQEKNKNKPKVIAAPQNSVKPRSLQLTAILFSATRKIAIIDEKMLSVGDSINGARLVSIKKDSARLMKNGKAINLSLSDQSPKQAKIIRKTAIQKMTSEKKL